MQNSAPWSLDAEWLCEQVRRWEVKRKEIRGKLRELSLFREGPATAQACLHALQPGAAGEAFRFVLQSKLFFLRYETLHAVLVAYEDDQNLLYDPVITEAWRAQDRRVEAFRELLVWAPICVQALLTYECLLHPQLPDMPPDLELYSRVPPSRRQGVIRCSLSPTGSCAVLRTRGVRGLLISLQPKWEVLLPPGLCVKWIGHHYHVTPE